MAKSAKPVVKKVVKKEKVKQVPHGQAVHMDIEIYNKVRDYALREDKQLSKVFRRIVEEWIEKNLE